VDPPGFDLQGQILFSQDKIHLRPRAGPPVADRHLRGPVRLVGPQLHQEEMLKRLAEIGIPGDRMAPGEVPGQAHVKKVKLLGQDHAALPGTRPRGEAESQESVLEDVKIVANGALGDAGFAGQVGVVDQLAGGQGRHPQELRERRDLAGAGLGGDLLLQIIRHVGPQLLPGMG